MDVAVMDKGNTLLQIRLERPLYDHETLNQNYDYKKPKSSCKLKQRSVDVHYGECKICKCESSVLSDARCDKQC